MSAREIGTSMLRRPPRSAAKAERKNTWPEMATVGTAISAETR